MRASSYDGKTASNGAEIWPEVVGLAMVGLKKELAYNGHGKGMVIESHVLGDAFHNRCVDFQKANSLIGDGQLGPKTAAKLFRKRTIAAQGQRGIPDDLAAKMTQLESGWDPGAIGRVDNNDTGIVQINMPSHPNISFEDALDPAWAIHWGAQHLKGNYDRIKDWDGAVAAHNLGYFYANKWVQAGKPASGGPKLTRGDAYTLATNYVALVRKQVLPPAP